LLPILKDSAILISEVKVIALSGTEGLVKFGLSLNLTIGEVMNQKQDLVKKYQSHKNDTGSTDVQVALLTQKIAELAKHLKKHAKDSDSRRGLLMMVGKRRRLLNYLKKNDVKKYEKLIKDLGLKK